MVRTVPRYSLVRENRWTCPGRIHSRSPAAASYSAKSTMCRTGPPVKSMTTWKSMRWTRCSGASACQVRSFPMGPICMPTPPTASSAGKGKVLIPSPSMPSPSAWDVLSAMFVSCRPCHAFAVPDSPQADTPRPSTEKVRLLSLNTSGQQSRIQRGLLEDEHADIRRLRVDRPGPACRGHRPASRGRCRAEGRQRPSGHRDEPGSCRVHDLSEGDATRSGRPGVDRP